MIDRGIEWLVRGGPVMPALLFVGLVTYALIAERMVTLYGRGAIAYTENSVKRRRGLLILRAVLGVAPLLGLLGTVTGMISSFEGLTMGGRVSDIGGGIGQALITTQYGLAIAAPGIVIERIISQRSLRLERHHQGEA